MGLKGHARMTEIVLNGTREGYEKLKAIGPERLSEILGVRVTKIGSFEPEGTAEKEEDGHR